jgi:large subunit ribosomal protein L29
MPSAAELRELDDTELENKLVEARKELFNLRFQAATGRLDNNARVTQVRRDIARVLTVQRAREYELAESQATVGPRADEGTKEQ